MTNEKLRKDIEDELRKAGLYPEWAKTAADVAVRVTERHMLEVWEALNASPHAPHTDRPA